MIAWFFNNKRQLGAILTAGIIYAGALIILQFLDASVQIPALDYALQLFEALLTSTFGVAVAWHIIQIAFPTIDKQIDRGEWRDWWNAMPDNQKAWATIIVWFASAYLFLFALFLVRLP